MGVDNTAIRQALLALAKEHKLDVIAAVAVDQNGAGMVILHNDNCTRKVDALRELAISLRECAERTDGIADGLLADVVRDLIGPPDDEAPTSSN